MEQFGTLLTFINDNYLSITLPTQIIHLHGVAIRESLSRFAPLIVEEHRWPLLNVPLNLQLLIACQRLRGGSPQDLYFEMHVCCSGSLLLPLPHC